MNNNRYDFLVEMHERSKYRPAPPVTQDRRQPLDTCPHYTDSRFDTAQLLYGAREGDGFWNYSDRLRQWDYNAMTQAVDTANASGSPRLSAEYYEIMLTAYHGRPVKIFGIMAGVNRSNGYPYQVFGYKFTDEDSHE